MAGPGKRNPRSFLTFSKVKSSMSLVTQGGDEYANPGAVENLDENQIIWIFSYFFTKIILLKLLSRTGLPVRNCKKTQSNPEPG